MTPLKAMKTGRSLFIVGMLAGALLNSVGQPVITVPPQSRTNVAGTTATFSVTVTGVQPMEFQWWFGTTPLAGQTTDALVLSNVQPASAGSYSVAITNAEGGATSAVATLTVWVPPSITWQPTNQSASIGAGVTFSVVSAGTSPRFHQWRFNGADLPGKTSTSLVLTNLQLTNSGDYTVVVTNLAGAITSQVATLIVDGTFTKITVGHIVNDNSPSIGCAWGDYDNDGLLDLFVTNGGGRRNWLYRNNGDGAFTRITTGSIVNDFGDWRGCAWADYDNDGKLDLLVTSTDANGHFAGNVLYRNNGGGSFMRMTTNTVGRLAASGSGSEGCIWGDYNNDGWLDVFIARRDGNDYLFRAVGDGTFAEITTGSPVQDNRNNYAGAWADYDGDGRLDLFVASIRSETNLLYRNTGTGTLAQVTAEPVASGRGYFSGCAWADFDNDGDFDLFVAGGNDSAPQTNLHYRNNGDGSFTRVTEGRIVTDVDNFAACAWGDYDNDGFLDLFLTARLGRQNILYRNNGDATFTRVVTGSPANDSGESVGCAWADYNNDGFLDLFVANGAFQGRNNFLYRHNGNSNRWLKVKCVGTVSNRSAIGTKVRVKAMINGATRWQLRQISNGCGFAGGEPLAHFGLGEATTVDTLRIEWPSGTVQEFSNVAANQFLTVTEPPRLGATSASGTFQLVLNGGVGFNCRIEASTNLLDWETWLDLTTTNRTMILTDSTNSQLPQRFYRATILPTP